MNNKTNQAIQSAISTRAAQSISFRLGVVVGYDEVNNTATVVISKEQTDEVDEVLENVMCPRVLGLQTVAPNPGLQCMVVFKDNNITQPLITHFFNHRFSQFDYGKQVKSVNNLPYYLLGS